MIGAVARCDNGGLGNQTWELWRHTYPDRTLVVLTDHRTRGTCDAAKYDGPGVQFLGGIPTPDEARAFMRDLDVVFCCEALYLPTWMQVAREAGCAVVVQSNPEMHDARELAGARIVLPTPWEARRVPHERVLPVPVALDRFAGKVRDQARVFYHPAAPAMADRNGTASVLAALRYVTAEVTVIVRGALDRAAIARGETTRVPDNVTLQHRSYTEKPYWEAYPEADVLLLPRRYGGLSLPMQEAAALGMPVITTDLAPQSDYPHAVLVPTTLAGLERMKGGTFEVHTADPRAVAGEIDRLAADPDRQQKLSASALEWAESLSWSRWSEEYQATLRG